MSGNYPRVSNVAHIHATVQNMHSMHRLVYYGFKDSVIVASLVDFCMNLKTCEKIFKKKKEVKILPFFSLCTLH